MALCRTETMPDTGARRLTEYVLLQLFSIHNHVNLLLANDLGAC
jgi:hypothetical protein